MDRLLADLDDLVSGKDKLQSHFYASLRTIYILQFEITNIYFYVEGKCVSNCLFCGVCFRAANYGGQTSLYYFFLFVFVHINESLVLNETRSVELSFMNPALSSRN